MNARDFENFFVYDGWAMARLLEAAGKAPAVPEGLFHLLSEGLAEDHAWLTRLTGDGMPMSAVCHEMAAARKAMDGMRDRFLKFFAALSPVEMGRTIAVQEGSRMPFHLSLPMALTHVVLLHAARREKVRASLQAAGLAVPATDFLAHVRDRAGKMAM